MHTITTNIIARIKQMTETRIFNHKNLEKKLNSYTIYLSDRTKSKTPKAIKAIAAPTWAKIDTSLGKQWVKKTHSIPNPSEMIKV